MESALRLDDPPVAVFRANETTPWRPYSKRALLDGLCSACRALPDDQTCPEHTSPVIAEVDG